MKIAVVSPHRDDAAFSLGLSIGCWLHAGHAVTVVNCFTRSEYAPHAEFEFIHSNDRLARVTALRLREDQSWQKRYSGKLQLLDLNLKDAPLRLHVPVDEVTSTAVNPNDKAMAKIPKALADLKASALVLPLALGLHVDHVTAREAVRATGSAVMPPAFSEDLPYAAVDGELEPVFVTKKGSNTEAVERKRRLALGYDSQIPDGAAESIAQFCVQYGGRERLWGNASWRASELMLEDAL